MAFLWTWVRRGIKIPLLLDVATISRAEEASGVLVPIPTCAWRPSVKLIKSIVSNLLRIRPDFHKVKPNMEGFNGTGYIFYILYFSENKK